jgi:acylphosphatase
VTNRDDGQVEALVEGDEEAVDRVEHALRRGPMGARVESFSVELVAPGYRATGFSVR